MFHKIDIFELLNDYYQSDIRKTIRLLKIGTRKITVV